MLDRIEINPCILGGKPVIKGTRIPVYLILELLQADYDFQKILDAYPTLQIEDIKAALEYALIDAMLTPEEERILEEGIKEFKEGKAIRLEDLERDRGEY
ncbi:MAG: DUF433 domain-containing protein [Theionarchaea archaeon]|nr:DUF433 domain-containing protein [Theionarchaea archaeon]